MQFFVLLKSKVLLIGDARVLLEMQTGPLKKKVSFKISFKRVEELVTLYFFFIFILRLHCSWVVAQNYC